MRIGICGYATAGKDAVADILVEEFNFVKIGMSDVLDECLLMLDPIIAPTERADSTGSEVRAIRYSELRATTSYIEAKKIPEIRRLLQKLGTEVGRSLDEQLWVNQVIKRMDKDPDKDYIITGIRYLNEADYLDHLILVTRPGIGPVNDHTSDAITPLIEKADTVIHNDGTLEDLREKVIPLFARGLF